MPVGSQMSSANLNIKSGLGVDCQPTRKTSSNICPPDNYLKRVTCPRRQQFYKDLQQEEQTKAEGPRRGVYHACSKYRCPRAPRGEDSAPQPRAEPQPQKKPVRVKEAGDREEEARKTKLNFVIEKKSFRPPQKHRKGVVQNASNQKKSSLSHNESTPPATVDEGVQAYCKEATKNAALYNTHEGLGEHLKYGRFGNRKRLPQRSVEPASSRHVFGPAQKVTLDKERKMNGPGCDGPVHGSCRLSAANSPRNRSCHLTTSQVMHVDIKPRPNANSPPPLRKNKLVDLRQAKRRYAQYIRTQDLRSAHAFHPSMVYKQSIMRQVPGLPGYRGSSIMRVPSNQTGYNRMPLYCRMTPCPSRYRNVMPVPYNDISRRRSQIPKSKSPYRVLSSRTQSYDKQLASPYSRTRSSQSPNKLKNWRRPPKVETSNSTILCKPQPSMPMKSQHSISSSVRFQNLPSTSVVNNVSAIINRNVASSTRNLINRNVGSCTRNRMLAPQISRRMMSLTSTRGKSFEPRPHGRRPTTSLRDMSKSERIDTSSSQDNEPRPYQTASVRRRTYNRCLTPTLRRKILSGEVVRPATKPSNFTKVSTPKDQPATKVPSSTSSIVVSPDRHIISISTQTII